MKCPCPSSTNVSLIFLRLFSFIFFEDKRREVNCKEVGVVIILPWEFRKGLQIKAVHISHLKKQRGNSWLMKERSHRCLPYKTSWGAEGIENIYT